jgi:hypothetical protein
MVHAFHNKVDSIGAHWTDIPFDLCPSILRLFNADCRLGDAAEVMNRGLVKMDGS